ncbi:MAG: hypothetical protein RLZ98_1133 [Pseudomonadota bacterium]|jgi:hypothetical protein
MTGLSPFDPLTVVLVALLNPVVIAVAFLMGRNADQWQKLLIAAFAASLAGFLLFWVVTFLGIVRVKGFGGEAGIVLAQFLFGLVWAGIGFWTRPTSANETGKG